MSKENPMDADTQHVRDDYKALAELAIDRRPHIDAQAAITEIARLRAERDAAVSRASLLQQVIDSIDPVLNLPPGSTLHDARGEIVYGVQEDEPAVQLYELDYDAWIVALRSVGEPEPAVWTQDVLDRAKERGREIAAELAAEGSDG